ncbi:hypothetical protein DM01DRAFT_1380621 [Hesseltinella vesiculosa]|uniref:Galactose oxidase n=1 Tax=Hesseltinella vesiculosa TaxID=101127 RepID=A0A1X2GUW4_9FUNG|nr:hypothetical protein DM01DRAFT_1380621 [Hesseltinella vesiculosa]
MGKHFEREVYADSFAPTGSVPAQAFAACGVVKGDLIYCYGGSTTRMGTTEDDVFVDTSTISILNMTALDFTNIPTLPWVTADFQAKNAENIVVPVNNNSQLFLYAGFDATSNIGYVVNPSTSGFQIASTITPPISSPNSSYYVYEAAGVYVPSLSQVFVFGGLQLHGIGYQLASNSLIVYSLANNQLSMLNATTPGGSTRYGHTMSLSNNGSLIYVIGGSTWAPEAVSPQALSNDTLQAMWVFDTSTSQWSVNNVNTNASSTVPGRLYHTTTQIPGTSLYLIFGGVSTSIDNISQPQFYVSTMGYFYDEAKNLMFSANIANTPSGPNRLFTHAAVPYTKNGSSYVFILFGQADGGIPTTSSYILNVTDPSNMAWLAHTNNASPSSASPSSSSSSSSASSSLSTGAIVGIAVAVALVAIITSCVAVVYYFKRKKRHQDFQVELSDPRNELDLLNSPYENETVTSTQTPGTDDRPTDLKAVKPDGVLVTKPFSDNAYGDVYDVSSEHPSSTATSPVSPADASQRAVKPDGVLQAKPFGQYE